MTQAVYPVIGRQDRLPFYLTGIGISDPEYRVAREKGLVSHQFLFTSSGAGVLTVDDKKYILRAGSVFYIAPAKPHEYHPLAGEWVTNWLVFRGEHAGAFRALHTPSILTRTNAAGYSAGYFPLRLTP